jgi:HNH endonuclease
MPLPEGYRHSPEVIERIRVAKLGAKNPNWNGDNATVMTGRNRALRAFPARPCQKCGAEKSDRHHIDANTLNNDASNIAFLCRRCHMAEDGRGVELGRNTNWTRIPRAPNGQFVATDIETCSDCLGSREVQRVDGATVECGECGGRGYVEVEQ